MTVINVPSEYENKSIGQSGALGYDLEEEKRMVARGTEEVKQELLAKWKKRYVGVAIFPASFASVNPEALQSMLSFQVTNFYNDLTKKFGLNAEQRDGLAQVVWKIVLEGNFGNVDAVLSEKLGVDRDTAAQLAKALEQNILVKVQELAKKPIQRRMESEVERKNQLVSLKLQEALKKYEKLGEQHLSGNPIKLKIFESPVRPSIKNWIADYYEKVDARKHDSIERGNYLFHSENARRLTTGERQKVGTMLKALDEDSLVAVDPARQEMVFQSESTGLENTKIQTAPASTQRGEQITNKPQSTNSMSGMDFSSSHKFPFEQNANKTSMVPRQAPRQSNNIVDLRND